MSYVSVLSWMKVNTKEVCFGARDNSYGIFTMQHEGYITSFKLVHLRGKVSCRAVDNRFSNWGCNIEERLFTFFTNATDTVIFPQISRIKRYSIPGIGSNSNELTFNNLTEPMRVSTGQEFRVWYGEDLKGVSEQNNGGKTCMDVYALYV